MPTVQDAPPGWELVSRHEVRRSELEATARRAAAELGAGPGWWTRFLTPVHGDDEPGTVEVGVPLAQPAVPLPRGAVVRPTPARREAVMEVQGEDTHAPQIIACYERLAAWARGQGLEPAGPPEEHHLGPERFELRWPVR